MIWSKNDGHLNSKYENSQLEKRQGKSLHLIMCSYYKCLSLLRRAFERKQLKDFIQLILRRMHYLNPLGNFFLAIRHNDKTEEEEINIGRRALIRIWTNNRFHKTMQFLI